MVDLSCFDCFLNSFGGQKQCICVICILFTYYQKLCKSIAGTPKGQPDTIHSAVKRLHRLVWDILNKLIWLFHVFQRRDSQLPFVIFALSPVCRFSSFFVWLIPSLVIVLRCIGRNYLTTIITFYIHLLSLTVCCLLWAGFLCFVRYSRIFVAWIRPVSAHFSSSA